MKYRLLGVCAAAFCCAAPVFAQGLTHVELLGLQQQLRDDGCGVTHITGRMDAMTRSAVKKCESKYSGATDAKSMLAAMHIGFENGNSDPTMAMARSGEGGSMSSGGSMGGTMNDSMRPRTRRGVNGMMNDSAGRRMMRRNRVRDSTHRDSTMKMRGRDTTGTGGMVDMHKASPMTTRNRSTMGHNSSTMKHDTMPKPN